MTKRKPFSEAFLFGLVTFVLAWCGGAAGQESAQQSQQAEPYPVLSVESRSIVLTSSYPATLEGAQTVEIRPRVDGYIVAMRVDEGDTVEENQVLFRLNGETYQQAVRSAEADVEAAVAGVHTAEDEVQRLAKLTEEDILSDYQLKAAENGLQSRKAALSQARAALTNARVNLSYTYVRSPTDGVIGEIPYRIGSLVSSSSTQPLTVVSDISRVYAYFSMGESELLKMSQAIGGEGESRRLRRRAIELPRANLILSDGTTYHHRGDVKLSSGLIDTETGSASFRAVFPNPQGLLRSGATGTVQIPFRSDSSIVIPKSATYEIQAKRFVYRLADDNTVESVEVKTGPLSTDKLFVVERGLSEGDKVVVQGMGSLSEGTEIQPQPVAADSLHQALTTGSQRLAGLVGEGQR